ncbi:hemolysin family protein [Streptosporangium sp. NBC_01755]|uniref:hemolysin family protein n=1 Tax=unclassified Streptosporangium TaxID=2632669 RepID=UPI002DDA011F|nr:MULTISPECIES: hemolysin family protein [unclassified Streptosporangium]WSA23382.1 hemolysin family protein [Streptosporangium sp. NBC_01810]WSC98478.1 hemolysin family protein [Streptosporangium sp. NBC_01755]
MNLANGWLFSAVVLVVVGGLIASAETALTRISRVRAEEFVRDGRRGAVRLQAIVADPPRYLNLLLLLRLSCELVATVIGTLLFIDWLGDQGRAYAAAAAVMIVVSYVIVGVSPRTLGRQHAEPIALASAPLVYGLTRIFGPLPKLLILLGNAVTPGKGFREGPFTSEAELRDLVDLAEERRVIEPDEREMIHSVFELGDTLVREVMVPRTDMVFIERGKTLSQALSLALRSGFSRIPVVGENEDDVIGIAYLKDIARRVQDTGDDGRAEPVESIMRPATYVPESKPIDQLLREMQARQIHQAIVIDEYGGTAGLVTIEDILEEIVGEITDEYDQEVPRVEPLEGGAVRVTARLPVDDLEDLFGIELEVDDVETVGGLLAHALGRVPIAGSQAVVEGLSLTAESLAGRRNRIGTVLVTRIASAESDSVSASADQ